MEQSIDESILIKENKRIKKRFSKLSEAQISGLNYDIDKLTAAVQEAYNCNQAKANLECKSFYRIYK